MSKARQLLEIKRLQAQMALAEGAGLATTALRNRFVLTPGVLPDNVNAPSSYVLLGIPVTPKASGVFLCGFSLVGVASAADTLSGALLGFSGGPPGGGNATVSGGTVQGGVHYAKTSLVTFTAPNAPVLIAPNDNEVTAAPLTVGLTFFGFYAAPLGVQSAIILEMSSTGAKNYSTLGLSGGVFELP